MNREIRPWGGFEILASEKDYKVKRIWVEPGRRLSLQRHRLRSEHWYAVRGEGLVTFGMTLEELEGRSFRAGESIDIPAGMLHRVENRGAETFLFIELQRGEYFGEDDIERIEDDYGRI